MPYPFAGSSHGFMPAASDKSAGSVEQIELPELKRLKVTVGKLANGKPNVQRAANVLEVCLNKFNAVLQIPSQPKNEDGESYRSGPSL